MTTLTDPSGDVTVQLYLSGGAVSFDPQAAKHPQTVAAHTHASMIFIGFFIAFSS
jgi:hypothetical protein